MGVDKPVDAYGSPSILRCLEWSLNRRTEPCWIALEPGLPIEGYCPYELSILMDTATFIILSHTSLLLLSRFRLRCLATVSPSTAHLIISHIFYFLTL